LNAIRPSAVADGLTLRQILCVEAEPTASTPQVTSLPGDFYPLAYCVLSELSRPAWTPDLGLKECASCGTFTLVVWPATYTLVIWFWGVGQSSTRRGSLVRYPQSTMSLQWWVRPKIRCLYSRIALNVSWERRLV
jgi:hypothetical protein